MENSIEQRKNMVKTRYWLRLVFVLGTLLMAEIPALAQTWQASGKTATLAVAVENAACNALKDSVGITANRTVLVSCQANVWVRISSGGNGGGNCATPATFMFVAQTGVAAHISHQSNAITLQGTSCPAALSVSGGLSPKCSVNGSAFITCGGYMAAGDTLVVQQTSGNEGTKMDMMVSIGGLSAIFSVSTFNLHWGESQIVAGCVRAANIEDPSFLPGNGGPAVPGSSCLSTGPYRLWYYIRDYSGDSTCAANEYPNDLGVLQVSQYCQ